MSGERTPSATSRNLSGSVELKRNLTQDIVRLEAMLRKLAPLHAKVAHLDAVGIEEGLREVLPLIEQGEQILLERHSLLGDAGWQATGEGREGSRDDDLERLRERAFDLGQQVSSNVRAVFLLGRFQHEAVTQVLRQCAEDGETPLEEPRTFGVLLDQEV